MRHLQLRPAVAGSFVLLVLLAVSAPAVRADDLRSFDTPEAAAKALVDAARANDDAALQALAGDDADVVASGADALVKQRRAEFAKKADEKLALEGDRDARLTIVVGSDAWPFPIPLVKGEAGWSFDVASGREEILNRAIGRNELDAIEAMKAYVAAQITYALSDHDGDGVREYAQQLVSTPGKHDGLYWDDDDQSPLGAGLAPVKDAVEAMRAAGRAVPYAGYYWKILKAQGPGAPGGAYSYVINGNMIAGFALLAVPAEPGKTGIMSLMVSHHGKMYEKDLGDDCVAAAASVERFDPKGWDEVDPEE